MLILSILQVCSFWFGCRQRVHPTLQRVHPTLHKHTGSRVPPLHQYMDQTTRAHLAVPRAEHPVGNTLVENRKVSCCRRAAAGGRLLATCSNVRNSWRQTSALRNPRIPLQLLALTMPCVYFSLSTLPCVDSGTDALEIAARQCWIEPSSSISRPSARDLRGSGICAAGVASLFTVISSGFG